MPIRPDTVELGYECFCFLKYLRHSLRLRKSFEQETGIKAPNWNRIKDEMSQNGACRVSVGTLVNLCDAEHLNCRPRELGLPQDTSDFVESEMRRRNIFPDGELEQECFKKVQNRRDIWSDFRGEYLAYNAPFQLEVDGDLSSYAETHKQRYMSGQLERANYLFFLGDDSDFADAKARLGNYKKFLRALVEQDVDVQQLEEKIHVAFCPKSVPRNTFFAGEKSTGPYAILYFTWQAQSLGMPKKAGVFDVPEIVDDLRQRFLADWDDNATVRASLRQILETDVDKLFDELVKQARGRLRLRESVAQLVFSPTLGMHERVRKERREGRQVFHLGFGQAPFPVHPIIAKALGKAAKRNEYLPVAGLEELRESILGYYQRHLGIEPKNYDVCVGPGSKILLHAVQQAIQGDLLHPAPSWVSYAPQARLLNDRVVPVYTKLRNHYFPDAEDLEQAISKHADCEATKIILNYPNNPTGLTMSLGQMQDLAEFCRRRNILILSDEIYGLVDYRKYAKSDERHRSIAEFYPEGTVIFSGLSKHLSLGGWRFGLTLIPKSIRGLFRSVCAIGSETWSAVAAPIQAAAVEAYSNNAEIDAYIDQCTSIHRDVMTWIRNQLDRAGLKYPFPQGAFYLYPDFAPFAEGLNSHGVTDSEALADFLMDRIQVATLPGTAFGDQPTKLRLRIAGCDYDGAKALRSHAKNPLPETLVRDACPRIYEAIGRLTELLEELHN